MERANGYLKQDAAGILGGRLSLLNPLRRLGELPVIPVDERAAEVRAIKAG